MKKTILFAPIHYILDSENSGSEFSWAYELYIRIGSLDSYVSKFITGGTRGISDSNVIDLHIFTPAKLHLSLQNILYFYIKTFFAALRIWNKEKVDIIHHAFPFGLGGSFNLFALLNKKKFIVGPIQSPLTVHDSDISLSDALGKTQNSNNTLATFVEQSILWSITLFTSSLFRLTLIRATDIIVVNKKTRDIILSFGINKRKIHIIPPGIDCKKFPFTPIEKKEKKIIELLSVGHLRKRKGVDLILQAFAKACEKEKNMNLRIIGDGPQKKELQQLTRELNIEKSVIFEGFVSYKKIPTFYKKAHIFVSMSRSEAFATISLEAMASGLAVISSRVGGFEDIIEDKQNGYLIEQENNMQLTQRIIDLVRNRNKMKTFGERARKTIEKNYDWDSSIIPQYQRLYEKK